MRTTLRSLAAGLLACAALAGVALADPPIAVNPELTDPATLRYQFEAGSSQVYRMTVRQTMNMQGAGLGGGAQTEMTISMDTTQAVQSVEDQTAVIRQTTSNSALTVSVNGEAMPTGDLAGMVDGLSVTVTMNGRGQVLDTSVDEVSDPQMQQMLSMLEDSLSQMTLEFPEEALNIGASWTQALPLDMDQPGMDIDSTTSATYTFMGYAEVDSRPVAVLQSDIGISLSGSFQELGETTSVSGQGTGSGYTYFDNGSGTLLNGTMTMQLQMTIAGEGMSIEQNMNMTVTIELLPNAENTGTPTE